MALNDSYIVVKTIDNTPRVLFWKIDEFFILIIPLCLGLVLGSILLFALGPLSKHYYSKMKKKYPRGTFKHRLYWMLPKQFFKRSRKLTKIPASHVRKLVL